MVSSLKLCKYSREIEGHFIHFNWKRRGHHNVWETFVEPWPVALGRMKEWKSKLSFGPVQLKQKTIRSVYSFVGVGLQEKNHHRISFPFKGKCFLSFLKETLLTLDVEINSGKSVWANKGQSSLWDYIGRTLFSPLTARKNHRLAVAWECQLRKRQFVN